MQGFALKKIVKYASNRGFTDIMVFNQRGKELDGLLMIHLPDGPTAHFRLSNLVLGEDIKVTPAPHISVSIFRKVCIARVTEKVGDVQAEGKLSRLLSSLRGSS